MLGSLSTYIMQQMKNEALGPLLRVGDICYKGCMKYNKICEECKAPFSVVRFWARFCTGKCRARAFYRQKRESAPKPHAEPVPGQATGL